MTLLARLFAAPSPLRTRRGIDLDFPLLAGCLALLGLGLVMITSASSEVAAALSGNPLYHMVRHLIYLAIGISAAVATLLIPMAFWQRYGASLLLIAFALLVLVLIPGIGREVNGAKRWIGFGLFNLQPSELAKLFTVVFIAGYLVRRQDEVREKLSGFLKPMLVLGPMAVLLLAEPDFGATVVMLRGDGSEQMVRIVGVDEIDLARGHISWIAPIARVLIRARRAARPKA